MAEHRSRHVSRLNREQRDEAGEILDLLLLQADGPQFAAADVQRLIEILPIDGWGNWIGIEPDGVAGAWTVRHRPGRIEVRPALREPGQGWPAVLRYDRQDRTPLGLYRTVTARWEIPLAAGITLGVGLRRERRWKQPDGMGEIVSFEAAS